MAAGSAELARAEDLRRWRSQFDDATPLNQVQPRKRATMVGVVVRMRLNPGRGVEATIEDGSGRARAAWTGRTRLPGVRLGAGLRLIGTVAKEPDGTLLLRNPEYELVSEPYR